MSNYQGVNLVEHGYWKLLFILDIPNIPIENGKLPVRKL